MLLAELTSSEYNPFYHTYIMALGNVDLLEELKKGKDIFTSLLESIPEEKLDYTYAEGKWSLAEVLLHILDTERIFQYRALRIARNDKTELPGFDQDEYVPYSNATKRSNKDLIEEYTAIRNSTISLFASLDENALKRVGVVSGSKMSTRAIGFIISGHQAHHVGILQKRYLS